MRAIATAAGIAGLASAGVLALTSASPAFAVTKNPDGMGAVLRASGQGP